MKKIQVILSKTEHEYDVYALLTSFFPGVEVLTKAEINEEAEGRFVIEETAENIIFTLNFVILVLEISLKILYYFIIMLKFPRRFQ